MSRYYFTYGNGNNMPFKGGWTEVEAPDYCTAEKIFRAYHPDKIKGFLNCAEMYTEEWFKRTGMPESGNLGKWCHERITVTQSLLDGANPMSVLNPDTVEDICNYLDDLYRDGEITADQVDALAGDKAMMEGVILYMGNHSDCNVAYNDALAEAVRAVALL